MVAYPIPVSDVKIHVEERLHLANRPMTEWFQVERNVSDLSEVVLLSLVDSNGSLVIENEVVLWSAPKDIRAAYMTAKIAIVYGRGYNNLLRVSF
jgi:hypothetical protein